MGLKGRALCVEGPTQLCVPLTLSPKPPFWAPKWLEAAWFPGGTVVKNPPASAWDAGNVSSTPGPGRSLEEEMATPSSILAWKIPWTEEPGRPCGCKESDMTLYMWAHTHAVLSNTQWLWASCLVFFISKGAHSVSDLQQCMWGLRKSVVLKGLREHSEAWLSLSHMALHSIGGCVEVPFAPADCWGPCCQHSLSSLVLEGRRWASLLGLGAAEPVVFSSVIVVILTCCLRQVEVKKKKTLDVGFSWKHMNVEWLSLIWLWFKLERFYSC